MKINKMIWIVILSLLLSLSSCSSYTAPNQLIDETTSSTSFPLLHESPSTTEPSSDDSVNDSTSSPTSFPEVLPSHSSPTTASEEQSPTMLSPSEEAPTNEQMPPDTDHFQYGDTTATWNLEIAERYPRDEECTPELLLEKWLSVEGLTFQDLEERYCSQLLLTVALDTDGVETINFCYKLQADGCWECVPNLVGLRGHVAKYGIAHNRVIDSYTSPAGLWALGMAFGNAPKPDGLLLPWRDVTPSSDWVCDTKSRYFNTWQERDDPYCDEIWDYEAGEHLADYPYSYAYSCVIEFNTGDNMVPSRGCAIFLHCGDDYTAGCVSLPEDSLLDILLWLDPNCNPYILITGNPQSN